MKDGDIVRFRDVLNHRTQELSAWKYGLLIEYRKWEKIANVLHEGEVLRLRAEYVTKAGKKDILRYRNSNDC